MMYAISIPWPTKVQLKLLETHCGLKLKLIPHTIQDSAYWHIFSCGVAIKNTNYHTYPLGRVIMVEELEGNACRGRTSSGKEGNWINYTDMRPATEEEIDASLLARLFPPYRFVCKLTPMHKTTAALANGIHTDGDYTESYPYDKDEAALKAVGFDTLVFIASKEEDESRITCGNAILASLR